MQHWLELETIKETEERRRAWYSSSACRCRLLRPDASCRAAPSVSVRRFPLYLATTIHHSFFSRVLSVRLSLVSSGRFVVVRFGPLRETTAAGSRIVLFGRPSSTSPAFFLLLLLLLQAGLALPCFYEPPLLLVPAPRFGPYVYYAHRLSPIIGAPFFSSTLARRLLRP